MLLYLLTRRTLLLMTESVASKACTEALATGPGLRRPFVQGIGMLNLSQAGQPNNIVKTAPDCRSMENVAAIKVDDLLKWLAPSRMQC